MSVESLLLSEFDARQVSLDAADLEAYGKDWTRVFQPNPSAVVFPESAEDVARLMRLATREKLAVVPSGGRTGLAGGAVAANQEIVVSLQRMHKLGEVDNLGMTLVCGAGAVTQAVHQHCEPHGLTWPVDFASKGSSHVGGNIATNAGGVKVIRYGLTRNWVLGLQVVLADGTILQTGGALEKNNTGLDLRQLFIGSEGTLGIITEATLKLAPLPKTTQVALFALPNLTAVLTLFARVRHSGIPLSAFEIFTDVCLTRVLSHRKLRKPFSVAPSHYVLIEVEGDAQETFATFLEEGLALDAVVSQHSKETADLWALRESISESLSATGFPHKNDISLPIAALEVFVRELEALFFEQYPGFEICLFGHIGDGNLHLNVMKPEAMSKEEFLKHTHACDAAVFALVSKHHGSISAEHGIGLLKREHLHFTRSETELLLLRRAKQMLDPLGILNPNKIFVQS
jgi:FAD/FMN-containing dehydrogenase